MLNRDSIHTSSGATLVILHGGSNGLTLLWRSDVRPTIYGVNTSFLVNIKNCTRDFENHTCDYFNRTCKCTCNSIWHQWERFWRLRPRPRPRLRPRPHVQPQNARSASGVGLDNKLHTVPFQILLMPDPSLVIASCFQLTLPTAGRPIRRGGGEANERSILFSPIQHSSYESEP